MSSKWIFCILAACGLMFLFAGIRAKNVIPVKHAVPVNPKLVSANNEFGFKLFKQIATKDHVTNIFISPFSIASALDMTYNGAATTTKDAMAKTLCLDGLTIDEVNQGSLALTQALNHADSKVELETANSLWAMDASSLRPEFIHSGKQYYDADISGLKGAPKTINAWVASRTHGKIKEIVEQVDPLTVLFLVNATYFKGEWTSKFDKSLTNSADFHLPGGKTKIVQMMNQSGAHRYLKGDAFRALRLPYANGRVSMYVFLPDQNSNLTSFYKRLNLQNWKLWMSGFRKTELAVSLPRFKVEWGGNLNAPLKALGMGDSFCEGRHDFTKMTPDPRVYIYGVLHKSFVKVDEKGTEAAAATSVELRTLGYIGDDPFRMIVDRPFFCAIRDDTTGSILFMGAVTNPEE